MKIVFLKTHKYVCYTCNNQFDWGEDSFVWGKMEYKTVQEQKSIEKYFCSNDCINEFEKSNKKK